MIKIVTGDMLKASAEALVNTVNTVGVMGKGIALQFKEAFPYNNKKYVEACKKGQLEPGKLLPVWDSNLLYGRKLIINFPTKTHWRYPSKYEYIEKGLIALVALIKEENIKSIALPPLGCGNGGLEWPKVKEMITQHLGTLSIDVTVFEPNATIKELLQKESTKKDVSLTPSRALLMYALFIYESFGEYSSLFAANKLAYFLQSMGQPLKLKFTAETYGPYAIGVEKVLYSLNGIYLKGLEQQQTRPFESLQLNYEKWNEINEYVGKNLDYKERERMNNLFSLINGFASELSLEILATTAFILQEHPKSSFEQVMDRISQWSERKKKLFKKEYVQAAYDHLNSYRNIFA